MVLTVERDPWGARIWSHWSDRDHWARMREATSPGLWLLQQVLVGCALQVFLVSLLPSSFAVTHNSLSLSKGHAFIHTMVSSAGNPFLLWAILTPI